MTDFMNDCFRVADDDKSQTMIEPHKNLLFLLKIRVRGILCQDVTVGGESRGGDGVAQWDSDVGVWTSEVADETFSFCHDMQVGH